MRFIANLQSSLDGTATALARDAFAASAVAAVLSGVPSTVLALRSHDLRGYANSAVRAAAALIHADEAPAVVRWPAAGAAHAAISFWWSAVLTVALPRRHPLRWGPLAGGLIAAIDLGIVGRRYPAVRALDRWPQLLDHIAFGMTAASVIAYRRSRRASVAHTRS